jgi:hypothetical protein
VSLNHAARVCLPSLERLEPRTVLSAVVTGDGGHLTTEYHAEHGGHLHAGFPVSAAGGPRAGSAKRVGFGRFDEPDTDCLDRY